MLGYGMVFLKVKLIHYIGDSMEWKDLIEISNKLSNKDIKRLIQLNHTRIFVYSPENNTCYNLDDEAPACLNGSTVQINLEKE